MRQTRIGVGKALALEAIGVSKQFGPVKALVDVGMKVPAASFHALLGENGAGKSTLVKCVMGYYRPDSGAVLVDDREHEIANPRVAHDLGIGMVYQHFTLVPAMSVAENLVMGRSHVPPVIDWKAERRELDAFMARMPFAVPLDAAVASLAAGEKQKVEILKQLYLDRRLLILDEPTSVLTPAEADEVLGMLRDRVRTGQLTVLMITHKFREVMAFADEVTVLRRGRLAGAGIVSELTTADLSELLIGSEQIPQSAAKGVRVDANERLQIRDLVAEDDAGAIAVDRVDLAVRSGEIVGIAGVSGNGQSELMQVLAGQREPRQGEILVHGKPYGRTREEMSTQRVFCLPEEPLRNGCVPQMSVAENLSFRVFDQPGFAAGGWWLNRGALRQRARELIARYRIRTPSPEAPISALSGGNVQRTVLARELSGEVEVLIVANPCFGLDFLAVAEIRAQVIASRNRGTAVLLLSEDLDEILELSDRVFVMFEGRLVYETAIGDADLGTIGARMAGH
jgi:general nucleoside transport system ATP-binding protein